VTSTASDFNLTGVTAQHPLTVSAWIPGQHPTTLDCNIIQRIQPASSLTDRTSTQRPTQTWNSRVSARTADFQTDVSYESSRGHHIAPPSTPPRLKVPAHNDPVKRRNILKAGWKRFYLFAGESVERLPPPDTPDIEKAYQDFCENLHSAARQCIPRGRRKNYVASWDKECETLYRSFIQAPVGTASDRVASSLLSRLQQKKQ